MGQLCGYMASVCANESDMCSDVKTDATIAGCGKTVLWSVSNDVTLLVVY